MSTEHPITPPPELVRQWAVYKTGHESPVQLWYNVANQAARWGADQELDACRKWVDAEFPTYPKCDGPASYRLADARRPKPPSLAEQALTSLSHLKIDLRQFGLGSGSNDIHTIRAALERLQELEKGNE